ncbi:FAD-dependent oxidoreductase, partial [Arthrospira platensis SPKY2]
MLYDAIIIGGGVTGCTIARELMRYAIRVALIESEA